MPYTSLAFPIGASDPLGEIAWSKIAHVETQYETFWAKNGMTAKAGGPKEAHKRVVGAPIILHDELGSQPGSEVRVRLRKQLTRTPRTATYGTYTFGITSMLGNEEALVFYDTAVKLGLLKHATGFNSPDFYSHYTSIDMEGDSEDALKEWLIENHEEAILDAAYEKYPYFIQQQLSESAVDHPRTVYANGKADQASMTSSDILSANEVMRIRNWAKDRKINPVKVDGTSSYILLSDTFTITDLRQDSNFQQLKDAAPRGADNPIVSGAVGVYQQMLVYEYERARTMTSGAEKEHIARALVLGADSIAVAYGSRPRIVPRVETSYGDRWGRAIRQVFGAVRCDFLDSTDTTTLNQSSAEWRVWRTAETFAA